MIKSICSVRDFVAGVYSNPFVAHNDSTALRDFGHAVGDAESQLNKSPEGYALFKIGLFDDDTGAVSGVTPQLLANATQFVRE